MAAMKTGPIKSILVTHLLVIASGCASVSIPVVPDIRLGKEITTFYVVKREGDKHGINKMVSNELTKLGYQAESGPGSTKPQNVGAWVTYKDDWMWDITVYLLSLEIKFMDPANGELLGVGRSYRPSLQRKKPEFMVSEILERMFKTEQ